MRSPLVLGLLLLMGTACPKTPAAPTEAPNPEVEAPEDAAVADPTTEPAVPEDPSDEMAGSAKGAGEPCMSAADCESGICEGKGCGEDQPGQCVSRERMCTRDAVVYCSCDGETFIGSGSCPGQRYSTKGPCEGDPNPLTK